MRRADAKKAVVLGLTSHVAKNERAAVFLPDGKVKLPTGFCKWVFVGAPLTPNGRNNGMANFPEFHNVFVEQKDIDAFLMTGSFPEGTVIVKELTPVLTPMFQDGAIALNRLVKRTTRLESRHS